MSRYILGLHAGHNASACIGDSSGVLFAIQEERIRREKNYWGFPEEAVKACLAHVDASPRDLVAIAYGGKQVFCRYHSRDDVLIAYRRHNSVLGRLRQRIAIPLVIALQPTYGQNHLRDHLKRAGLGGIEVTHYDHHSAHAASAYYGLRKDADTTYLVLTCDGDGDTLCASVRTMGGGATKDIASTTWDNSLGALYSWVTFAMGFMPLEHEYKLMGMAPYASPKAAREMADVFGAHLELSRDRLTFQRKTRKRMTELSVEIAADLQGRRFDHICAGLQLLTEDLLAGWVDSAVKASGANHVLAGGGVFMNVKANKRIAELDGVESFEAFPSCGDESLPFGAFFFEAARRFGEKSVPALRHLYLGDAATDSGAEEALAGSGFVWSRPADMASAVAGLLVAGHPVARCTGRMQFGARALGNRSILADPSNQDVVRVINRMIKKRDFWMPFAPLVLAERQDEYLRNEKGLRSPFMMMTFDSRENFREMIAAVHGADLTCRAQILARDENPELHAIVSEFASRTGRAVILNTSFNLHGYPIVRTPEDALSVFRDSGLEHLQLGNYLVRKA